MIMKGNGPAASEHIQHGAEIKSQLFLDILFSVATSLLLGQTLSLSLSLGSLNPAMVEPTRPAPPS